MLLLGYGLSAQTYIVPTSGNSWQTIMPGNNCTILDPGGTGDYYNNCNGELILTSTNGAPIHISGTFTIENSYDRLTITDGNSLNALLAGDFTGNGNIDIYCISGIAHLIFHSDNSVTYSGFELTASVCAESSSQVQDVTCIATDSSINLSWEDYTDATQWTVQYGTEYDQLNYSQVVSTKSAIINGLQSNRQYYFRIHNTTVSTGFCDTRLYCFSTICQTVIPACIDYTDLYSCLTVARYGSFDNPDQSVGVIDNGSNSSTSRHTVHTDQSEYDANTGYGLKTIPAGYAASVRLGNWNTGSQAESITYQYSVDTLRSDLLILKYAAVLENPNHDDDEQPRFKFQILDSTGNEVNAMCYSADFISNASLGWNTYGAVLWKDWTTVGVDLTPLQGQTIYIKLTTFDCSQSGHYGYAYFVFDCTFKALASTNCGNSVENTFIAPDGFGYLWYKSSQPDVTLATTQSLHVTQAGEYHCELSFLGAPAGANCSFSLTAVAGERYPTALMSYQTVDADDEEEECDITFQFFNNSVISSDSEHQQLTSLPCEGIYWLFDDSIATTESNPIVTLRGGRHSVKLMASLGGGICVDTLVQSLYVTSPCQTYDTMTASICQGESYTLFDTAIFDAGTYIRDSGYLQRTLLLTVMPTSTHSIDTAIVENALPLIWNDSVLYCSGGESDASFCSYQFTTLNAYGCDSTVTLNLTVWNNVSTTVDSTICENSMPITWNGMTFDTAGTQASVLAAYTGADSTVIMIVNVLRNSSMERHDTVVENSLPVTIGSITFTDTHADTTWIIPNAAGCDSTITYSLHVWHNVAATADSTICENSLPIVWNGATFDAAGTQAAVLAAHTGADSTVTMNLNVLHNSTATFHDTVIENSLPFMFGGHTFWHPVTDTVWIIDNAVGCDSIIHFSLHVWENRFSHIDSTVCDNQLPLTWNGITFNAAGTQAAVLAAHTGADSTVELTLTVNATYITYDTSAVCDGETAAHGYTEAGDYDIPLTSIHNCDSLVHLHVIIHPVYDIGTSDTICDNETTTWDSHEVATPGRHETMHTSSMGCDSLLSLELTVYATDRTMDFETVCNGMPYTWQNGVTYYNTTYEPTVTYTNRYGCDSVVQLILNLDDGFKARMSVMPGTVDLDHYMVRLQDISDSRTRVWEFYGHRDTSLIAYFNYPVQSEDSVEVLLIARNSVGCIDTARSTVYADRNAIWAPNAFTPDETNNNIFTIVSNDIANGHIWIYDRQGTLVTHFDLLSGSWDGNANGHQCPQGTYVWILKYTTIAQPQLEKQAKGTVTLIR